MIPVNRVCLPDDSLKSLDRCVRSTWLGYGPECKELEGTFTQGNVGWALATSSCTSALHLAAKLTFEKAGDEAILSPITFVSAAMAFAYAGFTLRFADVDPDTLMASLTSIERLITPRTKVVVAVHLYGQRASNTSLRNLCDRFDLKLVEDCAHRLDLLDNSSRLSDFSCYSFNAVKEVPCGEGGLIWGKKSEDDAKARSLSNAGLDIDTLQRSSHPLHLGYEFSKYVGLKLRLNDILASLVNPALKQLSHQRKLRRSIFDCYNKALREMSPHILPLPRKDDDSHLMYIVRVEKRRRDQIRQSLAQEGISTSVHYPSLTDHVVLNKHADVCPVAEQASQELISLPCFPSITFDEQLTVIQSLGRAIHLPS